MHSSGRSSFRKVSDKAYGSLAARVSFTIRLLSSTTQIAVSSKDTSNPALDLTDPNQRSLLVVDSDPKFLTQLISFDAVESAQSDHYE